MNIAAWILQVLLAVIFVFHGVLYVASPEALVARMRQQGQWPPTIPTGFRIFIGVAELFGAIGLIGPALTHILPWLTPLAALGLAVVMASASVYHIRRKEPPTALVLMVLALAVVYLRWQVVPIS
jgi:uncharacterized membrane protein YphA (DoxX/SURF4 family)